MFNEKTDYVIIQADEELEDWLDGWEMTSDIVVTYGATQVQKMRGIVVNLYDGHSVDSARRMMERLETELEDIAHITNPASKLRLHDALKKVIDFLKKDI